ncbi:uncharacterized protein N7459_004079 [Penicillium hispanicum]|uniref:uncharacterized protein n=1 Tax=Penicillium hispanicum TaxID=1080232 RepID=UPI00253FD23B|nr:uncharacterized protein N7459_004079 [Penicillium hispanicum]KAJ5584279.1 hypothetical protein N7459_004079 [Penicillium hispanicum]
MSSPVVFVCGATGTQGGALTHHLLANNIEVHAITRNPLSPPAQKLQSRGVLLSEGDFDDEESLRHAMANCTTLFLNLIPTFSSLGHELEQAKRIIRIAKETGIKHLIYTGALGTTNPEKLRHWNPASPVAMLLLGKQAIENEVRYAGFDQWTILRPGNFMSNFLDPLVRMYQGLVETGTFTTAFTAETMLPMVDPNDIGRFAAAAVLDPSKFHQEEIEIASELMGAAELMQTLSQATGKHFQAAFLTDEEIQKQSAQNLYLSAQLAMRDMAQFVDINRVKSWNIELGTFAQFLEREKERVQDTFL